MLPLIREIRDAVDCHVAALPVPVPHDDAEPSFQSLTDPGCDCLPGGRPFPTALDPFLCNRYEIAEFAREAAALDVRYLGVCCGAGPHMIRSMAEALGRRPPASRYSPDMSRHAFLGTDATLQAHNRRLRAPSSDGGAGDAAAAGRAPGGRSPRWRPSIRRRARDLDERAAFGEETFAALRAAGLLALTAPVEYGGAGLWWDGRYGEFYELLEAARVRRQPDGAAAPGPLARARDRLAPRQRGAARAAPAGDRRGGPAARLGRQRGQADRQARRHRPHRARGARPTACT